jgi:hypothetical protein
MSETHTPPPYSPTPSPNPVSHATNMARNIAVSVISTVLGATLIYYLGFRGDGGGGDKTLITKEATTKAWKSFVTVENIYYKNTLSLVNELKETKKLADFNENVIKESEKFQRDLPEVLKDKNIDGAFISMIQRRLENEKNVEVKMKKYLDNIQSILDQNLAVEKQREKLDAEDNAWTSYTKGARERAITDIEDLAKTLSDRYQVPFAMTDFLEFNEIKKETPNTNKTDNTDNNKTNTNNPDNTKTDNNNNNPGNPGNTGNLVPADPDKGNNNNNAKDNTNNNAGNVNTNKAIDQNQNTTPVNEKWLAGQWDTKDAGIDLYKNGSMYWTMDNGEKASGTWKFSNNQLYMYPKASQKIANGTTWIFNLSNVTPNSFTMTLSYKPFNTYYLIRSDN